MHVGVGKMCDCRMESGSRASSAEIVRPNYGVVPGTPGTNTHTSFSTLSWTDRFNKYCLPCSPILATISLLRERHLIINISNNIYSHSVRMWYQLGDTKQ
jgi:hypothetical protein